MLNLTFMLQYIHWMATYSLRNLPKNRLSQTVLQTMRHVTLRLGKPVSGIRFHRLQKAFIMKSGKLQAKEKAMESRDEEAVPILMKPYEIS